MSPVGEMKQETGMYILSCEYSHSTEIREAPIGEPKKVHENEARLSYTDRRLGGYDMAQAEAR
jgi:hypothetical protein